jgi:predicted acyltransferase
MTRTRDESVWWRYVRAAALMAGVGIGLVLLQLGWSITEGVSREIPRPSALPMTAASVAMLVTALWAASRPASAAAAVNPAELLRGD